MERVASDDLSERIDGILERVASGNDVLLTVDGRAVARVTRASGKPRWMPKGAFLADLRRVQADVGLRADLDELAPDATDEVGPL